MLPQDASRGRSEPSHGPGCPASQRPLAPWTPPSASAAVSCGCPAGVPLRVHPRGDGPEATLSPTSPGGGRAGSTPGGEREVCSEGARAPWLARRGAARGRSRCRTGSGARWSGWGTSGRTSAGGDGRTACAGPSPAPPRARPPDASGSGFERVTLFCQGKGSGWGRAGGLR